MFRYDKRGDYSSSYACQLLRPKDRGFRYPCTPGDSMKISDLCKLPAPFAGRLKENSRTCPSCGAEVEEGETHRCDGAFGDVFS